MSGPSRAAAEWPTLALLALCYGAWALGTTWLAGVSLWTAIFLTGVAVALFASLQHEILHGHPFRSAPLGIGVGVVSAVASRAGVALAFLNPVSECGGLGHQ